MTTNKTRKPVKGDTVTLVSVWSTGRIYNSVKDGPKASVPAIRTRVLRVECWGKQQAHFTDVATGEFIKERGYTEYLHVAFDADGLAELLAEVKSYLATDIANRLPGEKEWLARAEKNPKVNPKLVAATRDQIAILEAFSPETVRVATHAELMADIKREVHG